MSLQEKLNSVDDRTWQAFTALVQILFIVAIVGFSFVAFETQEKVNEFKEQVDRGNCSAVVFDNGSSELPGQGLELQNLEETEKAVKYPD